MTRRCFGKGICAYRSHNLIKEFHLLVEVIFSFIYQANCTDYTFLLVLLIIRFLYDYSHENFELTYLVFAASGSGESGALSFSGKR